MSSFIEQMGKLRSNLSHLVSHLEVPNIKTLIIRKKVSRNVYEYLQINPTPVVTINSPMSEPMTDVSAVKLLVSKYSVKGVSRNYKASQLFGDGIDYVIGGEMRLGVLVGGVSCKFVSCQENSLTWDIELEQKIGEQSLY
jgi:hypothetical protein